LFSAAASAQTKISVFAPQQTGFDMNTNETTLGLEKMFNIDLQFETTTVDAAAAAEKRQISLASGSYPDVFMLIPWVDQFSRAELIKFGGQGVILPLDDLIEKYAPNLNAFFVKHPEYRALATAPDGKIWGLPQWNDCFHCSYASKLWINTDWLNKLGLTMPKTTEDMKNVLTAFKTKDPNGNGKADEIPLTSSKADVLIPYFMNAFTYDPRATDSQQNSLVLDGSKVAFGPAQDGWRKGLQYMASLFKDGLVDSGAFTQNRDAVKALGDNADAPIVGAATMLHPAILNTPDQADGRDQKYDPVPPLTGPDGTSYASFNLTSSPGATFVITNKATPEVQVAAIKMLDYFFTEGGAITTFFGPEGGEWKKPAEGDLALDPKVNPLYVQIPRDPNKPIPNLGWFALAQYAFDTDFRGAQVQPMDIHKMTGYERRLFEATVLYQGHEPKDKVFPYWLIWVPADQSEEVAQLQTNLTSYVTQSEAEFATGQRDINDDAAWADYLANLESLGLPRYLELYQAAYDAVKK
jgi:putative aldouronate transport system substrate-binding protein